MHTRGINRFVYPEPWHVKQQGLARDTLAPATLEALLAAFQQAAFFGLADTLLAMSDSLYKALPSRLAHLDDSTRQAMLTSFDRYRPDSATIVEPLDCTAYWRHFPVTDITFRSGGKQRAVRRDYGCAGHTGLEKLGALEAVIDSLTHVRRWVGEHEGEMASTSRVY